MYALCMVIKFILYLQIVLRSPSGTNSTLLKQRSGDYSSAGFADWAFTSVHYWGENPSGNWTFFITTNGRSGTAVALLITPDCTKVMCLTFNNTCSLVCYTLQEWAHKLVTHELHFI